jgi:hypothetical protein
VISLLKSDRDGGLEVEYSRDVEGSALRALGLLVLLVTELIVVCDVR